MFFGPSGREIPEKAEGGVGLPLLNQSLRTSVVYIYVVVSDSSRRNRIVRVTIA